MKVTLIEANLCALDNDTLCCWNPESRGLESGIHNGLESGTHYGMDSGKHYGINSEIQKVGIRNPEPSWILLHGANPESRGLESGIQNGLESGIRNPLWYGIRNSESWNPESRDRDPESRTFMDSLAWGEILERLVWSKVAIILQEVARKKPLPSVSTIWLFLVNRSR